jgi:hypothetical protein
MKQVFRWECLNPIYHLLPYSTPVAPCLFWICFMDVDLKTMMIKHQNQIDEGRDYMLLVK